MKAITKNPTKVLNNEKPNKDSELKLKLMKTLLELWHLTRACKKIKSDS